MEEKHAEVVSIRMAAELLSGLDKRDTEHAAGYYVTTQAPGSFVELSCFCFVYGFSNLNLI